jgi:hypothetical protein
LLGMSDDYAQSFTSPFEEYRHLKLWTIGAGNSRRFWCIVNTVVHTLKADYFTSRGKGLYTAYVMLVIVNYLKVRNQQNVATKVKVPLSEYLQHRKLQYWWRLVIS